MSSALAVHAKAVEKTSFSLQFEPHYHALDFDICIEDHRWTVHSNVISKASGFFDKVCNGSFKETKERRVMLHDDEPIMVARMVQFMYCGRYSLNKDEPSTAYVPTLDTMLGPKTPKASRASATAPLIELMSAEAIKTHASMYLLADKYDIKSMSQLAMQSLRPALKGADTDICEQLVQHVGISALQYHTELCLPLLRSLARIDADIGARFELIKVVIEGDHSLSTTMLEYLVDATKFNIKEREAANSEEGKELEVTELKAAWLICTQQIEGLRHMQIGSGANATTNRYKLSQVENAMLEVEQTLKRCLDRKQKPIRTDFHALFDLP